MVIKKYQLPNKKRTYKRVSKSVKASIVEEYKAGGITIEELHKKHGSCARSISNWIVKAGASKSSRKKRTSSTTRGYVEVQVPLPKENVKQQPLSIYFNNGMELKFHTDISASYISSIVKGLGY